MPCPPAIGTPARRRYPGRDQQEAAAIRLPFILLAAAFAAAPALAKPPAPDGAPDAGRERGIALCVAESTIAGEPGGGDLDAICGCAIDRFIEGRGTAALGSVGSAQLRRTIASELTACVAELRPERASDVAGRDVAAPEAKPPAAAAPPAPPESARFDPGAWLRGRLAALPGWAWMLIGVLALVLVGAAVRRRDDRRHLLGPPPSMRPGAAPRPRPFRLEL